LNPAAGALGGVQNGSDLLRRVAGSCPMGFLREAGAGAANLKPEAVNRDTEMGRLRLSLVYNGKVAFSENCVYQETASARRIHCRAASSGQRVES
jgi:hypothetical protein